MKTKSLSTLVTLFLMVVLLIMSLSSCSSPLADPNDQFSIGQAQAMMRQQENQARASAMMQGRPSPLLQPIPPLAPIR